MLISSTEMNGCISKLTNLFQAGNQVSEKKKGGFNAAPTGSFEMWSWDTHLQHSLVGLGYLLWME